MTRTIAGLSGWAYSVSDDEVWIHLYSGSTLKTKLPDGTEISLEQKTDYPWDGHIAITFRNTPDKPVSVKLRIPDWAEGATLTINGRGFEGELKPCSYATLKRRWSAGDTIELELPLKVRLIEAHPNVVELRDSVAVMRGPVVYCLELPKEQNGESIWNNGVFLHENIRFESRYDKDRLGGITVLTGRAMNSEEKQRLSSETKASISSKKADWTNQLYREFEPSSLNEIKIGIVDIELIPYFAWANRGICWMEVWIPLAR